MEIGKKTVDLQKAVKGGKEFIDACISEDLGVICINKQTKKQKSIPFKNLYTNNNHFWELNDVWEYFLDGEDMAKIEKKLSGHGSEWVPVITETGSASPGKEKKTEDDGFGKEYAAFASLSEEERVKRIDEDNKKLDAIIAQKTKQAKVVTEALVETTQDAILYNYTSLLDAMSLTGDEAKKQTQNMVESTRVMVQKASHLISADIFNDELMNALVAKSNGATIQHMIRVYLKGLSFLSYYNKLISGSSIANKLRISFKEKYYRYYQGIIPQANPDELTITKVFLEGMQAVPEQVFYNWAIGFLVHDIGKAASVEYYEGEATYDRNIIVEHVKLGHSSIINKTNYPIDAAFIAGYHHEYYGDPSGYGSFRSGLDQQKIKNPKFKIDSCITYNLQSAVEFRALSFFPAKILEVVDVFDSLTDPNRKYRKALSAEEALAMMEEEFINKHAKLDIILFDLFKKFVNEDGRV